MLFSGHLMVSPFFIDSNGAVEKCTIKPRKLLILVNPNSGQKKANQLFRERVKPVLAEAGINFDIIITGMSSQ